MFLLLVIIFLHPIWARDLRASQNVQDYSHLLNSKNLKHSILFTSLEKSEKPLFESNSRALLSPASLTKIVTAAATFSQYGTNGTFQTSVFYSGDMQNGVVRGNLVFKGVGDPFLVSEKLWQLAVDLKNLGIKEIAGKIMIDDSYFDAEERDVSRLEGEKKSRHAYDAPISALAVNFNTLAISIAPGQAAGQPALVALDPYPLAEVTIQNRVQTTVKTSAKSTTLDVSRVGDSTNVTLIVDGTISVDSPIKKIYRSTSVPLSASIIQAFLQKEGIVVRQGDVLSSALHPLLSIESYDMRKIVQGLNTFSNNFIADMLTKKLGADMFSPPGTLNNGARALKKFLVERVGIKSNFEIENGSGLDVRNRLSCEQIVEILKFSYRQNLFVDLYGSLPSFGNEGTLKKRGRNQGDAFQSVRAKSGTLTEPIVVSGLAGVYKHVRLGFVGFCILSNGISGRGQPNLSELHQFQEALINRFL